MIYGLLGEFRVGNDDRFVALPAGHSLIIFAALALNANKMMRKEDLIRAAWGEEGVSVAQLHKRISEIRKILSGIGREEDLETRNQVGYRLVADAQDIDILLFQGLLEQADIARGEQRITDEMELRRTAINLWHGPHPLVNVRTDAFRYEISRLEERRRRAAAQLFEWELGRGNGEDILPMLDAIFTAYPADRKLCGQLMVAAVRADRSPIAMAAFERHRETIDEQGQDPDRDLRGLYFAIAQDDQPKIEEIAAAFAPAPSAMQATFVPAVPRQMPPDNQLIGRGELAAEVSWLLARTPTDSAKGAQVLVISGPGGIGKTALALRASYKSISRYPDGQLHATLRDTSGAAVDAGEILAQFLRGFGVTSLPEGKPERRALYRTLTADRQVLVLLDDAADGAQVADLVPANPACTVVVTSRARLPEVTGAHHVAPLEPLRRPSADQLFLRVIRQSGISLTDDEATIGRVVELCGGLPLALRIAAALRVRDHPRSTAALIRRLERQGQQALSYGDLSVARTIGAGFDRLDPEARQLILGLGLLRLPTFATWTAQAILGAVTTDPETPLSLLGASFMIEATGDEPRYRFHDLTRDWAEQRARDTYAGDEPDAIIAHVYTALLTLVRHAHISLYGGSFDVINSDVPDWVAPASLLAEIAAAPLDWFEAERLNIRAAVEHCAALGLTDICWDMAVSSHEFYTISGYHDDWYATHVAALRACQSAGDQRGEGIVLISLGQPALIASRRHGMVSGPAELERAIKLLADVGERHGQAIALRTLANALRRSGHLTRPITLFQEAREHYAASGDDAGSWQSLRFIGQSYLDNGQFTEARRVLEQAGVEAAAIGGQRFVAQNRYWIGYACLALGDLSSAQEHFAAVLDVFGDSPNVGQAYARHGLGALATAHGRYQDAAEQLDAAVAMAAAGSDATLEGRARLSIAALHHAQGHDAAECDELMDAISILSGSGLVYLEVRALIALANAETARGDRIAADSTWARIDGLYAAADVPAIDRVQRRTS